MSNVPKLSARAANALNVLADGGSFRYGLETNSYTRREQFQWRLKAANGCTVRGIGGAAYRELAKAGFAFRSEASGFTGIATHYRLNPSVEG
jgi:hypothetical protein